MSKTTILDLISERIEELLDELSDEPTGDNHMRSRIEGEIEGLKGLHEEIEQMDFTGCPIHGCADCAKASVDGARSKLGW